MSVPGALVCRVPGVDSTVALRLGRQAESRICDLAIERRRALVDGERYAVALSGALGTKPTMILLSARRAANLHVAGVECSETGNEGEAGCLFDATRCRVEPAERRHMECRPVRERSTGAQRAGAIENYMKALDPCCGQSR
jgi:hypothetical protein